MDECRLEGLSSAANATAECLLPTELPPNGARPIEGLEPCRWEWWDREICPGACGYQCGRWMKRGSMFCEVCDERRRNRVEQPAIAGYCEWRWKG